MFELFSSFLEGVIIEVLEKINNDVYEVNNNLLVLNNVFWEIGNYEFYNDFVNKFVCFCIGFIY